jgi:glucose-6-phosphate isomerase
MTQPLTQRPAWQALQAHHQEIQNVHLRQLFADDPQRGTRMACEAVGLNGRAAKQMMVMPRSLRRGTP